MTPPPPSPSPTAPSEALAHILHRLLPLLLDAAASVRALHSRWRAVHATLLALSAALSAAPSSAIFHPLFLDLLASLLPALRSLRTLSVRCLDPDLPSGRLLLQSDLDIASSSLSALLEDLSLLLRSGLLSVDSAAASAGNAIVLQTPASAASRADQTLFVRDAFARLQIGGLDLKLKALTSLLEFLNSDPARVAPVVASEGDVAALLRLLDASSHSVLRDRAAAAVSTLAKASVSSRRVVFDEGALGPLLRVLDGGSAAVATRERAAAAIESITGDASSAWAVAAYGGVSILMNACRPGSGSPVMQAFAVAALKNVASIEDVRSALVEEGGLPVLVDLLSTGSSEVQKSAVLCLWSLASMGTDDTRHEIVQAGALPPLLQSLYVVSDQELQDTVLRAVHALTAVPAALKILCSSSLFFAHLADLICRCGGSPLSQQLAAAMVADLAPSLCDDTKRCLAPCIGALVKMMEAAKPAIVQESAARALLALLTLRPNRKELVRDEKSVMRLVKMLDPRIEEVGKKYPVSILLALAMGGGNGTRRRLVDAGACQDLQKLADADVPGAKKLVQRISGGRLKSLLSMGWNN